jgi:hypothetical protein
LFIDRKIIVMSPNKNQKEVMSLLAVVIVLDAINPIKMANNG